MASRNGTLIPQALLHRSRYLRIKSFVKNVLACAEEATPLLFELRPPHRALFIARLRSKCLRQRERRPKHRFLTRRITPEEFAVCEIVTQAATVFTGLPLRLGRTVCFHTFLRCVHTTITSHNLRPERVPEDNREQAAGDEAVARTQQRLLDVVVKDKRHNEIGKEDVKEHCANKHLEAGHSIGAAETSSSFFLQCVEYV